MSHQSSEPTTETKFWIIVSTFVWISPCCREAQAVAKGLVLEEGEEVPPAMKKKQILKRIREWERSAGILC